MIRKGRHAAFSDFAAEGASVPGETGDLNDGIPAREAPLMAPPDVLIRLLPPCLHWHPDGEIRLVGHRIGLYHFVYYYNQGFTAEMLLCQFPTLELATIHKVIAFYLDNREEVDRYAAEYQSELDALRSAGPYAPSVAEIRKRLEMRQKATLLDAERA
jgi:uncharacterized protein (DUF433 family)